VKDSGVIAESFLHANHVSVEIKQKFRN